MPRLLRPRPSSRRRGWLPSLDLTREQWLVAFLIGLTSVLAAFFGWRAAAIGSTAAFDDRQSISETARVQEERIEIALAVADDAREHTRYLADYAVAAGLDADADAAEAGGDEAGAAAAREGARNLRRAATLRAADEGVFGRATIADDVRDPRPRPRPFDLDEQLRARAAEAATALDSPGRLDPDAWAQRAEDIRDRINGLVVWAFVLVGAVVLFTAAEVFSGHRAAFFVLVALGCVVLATGAAAGFSIHFFA